MKFIKILFTLVIIYTISGIGLLYASSIQPAINRVALPQGQRMYGDVEFTNTEKFDVELKLTPHVYNPKTDDISEDKRYLFIKVDTDTIKIKAGSSQTIKYEIIPPSNQPEGTYYNILALTILIDTKDIEINKGIAQLVILDIVDADNQVKGITTNQYSTRLDIVKKGIPFLTPLKLKYTIRNDSNFLLIPEGRIDVFNVKNSYKPTYIYINEDKEKLFPGETLEKEISINKWHISDILVTRIATAQVYNGVDKNPQYIETEINSYIVELIAVLIIFVIVILLIKSLYEDRVKIKKKD